MTRSIDLLPQYFDELASSLTGRATPEGLAGSVEVGRRAERRMLLEVGSNAHRGYIFLAGLALLGAIDAEAAGWDASLIRGATLEPLRDGIRRVARDTSDLRHANAGPAASHGSTVRERHALGGIEREALEGLPSVFDHALPALRERRLRSDLHDSASRVRDADSDEPLHYAMAVLMQAVEDTTAVHRGGPDGLDAPPRGRPATCRT